MEYYEDSFQSYQESQNTCAFNYYAVMIDGTEWFSGSYEACVAEIDKVVRQNAPYAKKSDFTIETRYCSGY